jgi:hypothetical protein
MIILKAFHLTAKNKKRHRALQFPGGLAFRTASGKKALIAVALVIPLLFIVILIFSKYEAG